MVTVGIDAHKRTHTAVAVDDHGRQLASKTIGTKTKDHLVVLVWAEQIAQGQTLLWAVEDCRHLSRTLERDLLAAGQTIVRVPPKLMAHVRDSARTHGKSDPIDALAVARAAQREPNLPLARLDGPDRHVRLLADHRESLVNERTRLICRLRWFLHELDPGWEPKRDPWTASARWTTSPPASPTSTALSHGWHVTWSSESAPSPSISTSSPERSRASSAQWRQRFWRFQDAEY
jgi:transposase